MRRGEETYDGSRVHIRYVRVYPTEDLQKVKGVRALLFSPRLEIYRFCSWSIRQPWY